jgi:hypothetical protein
VFVELEDGGDVSASVAVVGRRPNGDQNVIWEPVLVSFLNQLMGSGDQLEAVNSIELLGNLRSE